jgi:hypothetical protein
MLIPVKDLRLEDVIIYKGQGFVAERLALIHKGVEVVGRSTNDSDVYRIFTLPAYGEVTINSRS